MSRVIDEQVVSMEFDNRLFEKNVEGTMSMLDRLKKSLNLEGASKGLEEVDAVSKNIDFSYLSGAIDNVKHRFSALEIMGITALMNITNSAINAGKRMASALTIDPIKTGLEEYETQINAVQTILANTQSKGSTIKDVNKALGELNKYADMTIYNFTEMTRNIGTFTAAGVDLDKSVSSIKGIANLAAVSGSTSQQASVAMYQISQALASGKVALQDWNSVVNAGMGGELFQNALKRTAKHMGKDVDSLIKKYGSFRESLTQGGWLTTEVLTETLTQLSGAYSEADLLAKGYSKEQAKEIYELSKTAVDAATKVKTFTQLWDTLQEAAQSGWTQSWEIIIGDFEEAKELFSGISDVISDMINDSSDARNKMLQEWKDLGGRTALLEAFKNTFNGLSSVVKPIREAFREVFPPTTGKQLYNLTVGLKNLTEKFKMSKTTADELKRTFKGLFSLIDIFVQGLKAVGKGAFDILKNLTGFNFNILGLTASIGDSISKFRDHIKKTDIFGESIKKITGFITDLIDRFKDFTSTVSSGFSSPSFDGFLGFFAGLFEILKAIGSGSINTLKSIGDAIAKAFGGADFFDVLNNGLFAGILLKTIQFVKGLGDVVDDAGGFFENITGILDDVRGCFEAYQSQLKAGALLKISYAIGILAVSLWLISSIDGQSMMNALGGITILFAELMGAMYLFGKLDIMIKGVTRIIPTMIAMSLAILILASAVKKLSTIDGEGLMKGLFAVGVLMAELLLFLNNAKFQGKAMGTAIGIVILSSAMLILAKAVKEFGYMEWEEIGKGLAAIGFLLTELSLFTRLTGDAKHVISTGISMVLLGAALKIFASVLKDFSDMDPDKIIKGLYTIGGLLAGVAISMHLMPKNIIGIGIGLSIVGLSLMLLSKSLSSFGKMSWEDIGKGLTALGGSLIILALSLKLMSGSIAGSFALLIAAGAIAVITPLLKVLGGMSWESIGKGLVALAGAFAVIGVAGALLTPVVPVLVSLAGAFALLGLSVLAIGAGVTLLGVGLMAVSAGITALGVSLAAGATAIVAGISVLILGIVDLIPSLISKFGDILIAFAQVIGEAAPELAIAFVKLISEVLKSLATHVPTMVESLLVLLIGIINGVANHLPELIVAFSNLVSKLFDGFIKAFNDFDTTNLLKGSIAVGILTALTYALSGILMMIPSAMAGLVGIGVLIAELALILAAIGKLSEISGLNELIDSGGNLLQKIGEALGKFVGSLIGGFATGVTDSLPVLAENFSNFMTKLKPFIDGAKTIDLSVLEGVGILASTILLLTGSELLTTITSWITGGSSLSDFGTQLIPFGMSLLAYSAIASGIDASAILNSAIAGEALVRLADAVPKTGGLVSWLTGENDIADFGVKLVSFGMSLKLYSLAVSDMDTEAVTKSAIAGQALVSLAETVPNTGGLVSWFAGDNDLDTFGEQLVSFGKNMSKYSDAVSDLNTEAVMKSAIAGKMMTDLAETVPETGGLVSWFAGDNDLATFGEQLVVFGKSMSDYSESVSGMDTDAVKASVDTALSLSSITDTLENSGGMISWFTGDNDLATFGTSLVSFGEGLKEYSDSIVDVDAEAIKTSADAAKSLIEITDDIEESGGIKGWFAGDKDLSKFGNNLKPFGEGLKAYADSVVDVNTEAIKSSAIASTHLVKVANDVFKEGGLVSLFSGSVGLETFSSNLEPLGKGMKAYSDSIVGVKFEAISKSSTAMEKIVNVVKNTSGINVTSVTSFVDALNKLSEANISGFIEAFKGSAGNLKTIGSSVIESIVSGMNTKKGELSKTFNAIMSGFTKKTNTDGEKFTKIGTKLVSKIIEGAKSKSEAFKNTSTNLMKVFTSGITGEKDKVVSAMSTILKTTATDAMGHYQGFYDAGAHVVSGFAKGISDNSYKAEAKSRAMAASALNAAKQALDVHSPSREFYKVGNFAGVGFINALRDNCDSAFDNGYEMANSAKTGLAKAISTISDLINDDLDTRPTIRPIVDLSDVKTGASKIGSLLGPKSSLSLMTNIGAISRYGQNQNGNLEVVSAINKLRKDIGKINNVTYSINGITYDDGSNVSNAVKSIIRATRMERRV